MSSPSLFERTPLSTDKSQSQRVHVCMLTVGSSLLSMQLTERRAAGVGRAQQQRLSHHCFLLLGQRQRLLSSARAKRHSSAHLRGLSPVSNCSCFSVVMALLSLCPYSRCSPAETLLGASLARAHSLASLRSPAACLRSVIVLSQPSSQRSRIPITSARQWNLESVRSSTERDLSDDHQLEACLI